LVPLEVAELQVARRVAMEDAPLLALWVRNHTSKRQAEAAEAARPVGVPLPDKTPAHPLARWVLVAQSEVRHSAVGAQVVPVVAEALVAKVAATVSVAWVEDQAKRGLVAAGVDIWVREALDRLLLLRAEQEPTSDPPFPNPEPGMVQVP